MNIPNVGNKRYAEIKEQIESGRLKIPKFQREFVWSKEDSAKLIDSIIKGYPLGAFIFWNTNAKLNSIKNIGEIDLPQLNDKEYVNYVLDGQQRITTLYAVFEGAKISRNGKEEDFSEIYIDLEEENESNPFVITDIKEKDKKTIIKLRDLLNGELSDLFKYDKKYHKKFDKYKQNITSYPFSIIETTCNISEATEIFSRLNTGGKKLTVFEIMVALTYDEDKKFDLSEKYNNLIENLEGLNYETISSSVFLHTIAILLGDECKKKAILELKKEDVINICDNAIECIVAACNYFKSTYRIPASRLLPYDNLVVPFAYYFYKTKITQRPLDKTEKMLKDYFWRTILTNRFGSSVETKLAEDRKKIDRIIANENVQQEPVNITKTFLKNNSWFNVGNAFIKGILCVYAYEQPQSFFDRTIVKVVNDGLKQSNSRDYHHFFPKDYLKKKSVSEKDANSVFNITFLDKYANRDLIRAKAPKVYLAEAKKTNDNLEETLNTHLIDINTFGIKDDDYETFLEKRIDKVIEKLKGLLILQETDIIDVKNM